MLEVHWHQGRRANIMSRVLPAESLETAPDPVHRRLRSDKEEGDEGPRWFLRPGPDVVLLVSVAIIARVFLWLLQPAAWYFSDSGDYIATFGWKPYSDNRSPALSWLWHIGTAFDYTERSVVLLQMALGVISVIALFDLLRRMVSRRRAFVVALAWAVFPLALVFERTLMPESVCSVLFILFLWLTTVAFLSPSERWRAIPAIGATFVLSLIFVIIPSLELACVVIAVMLFVVAWLGTSSAARSLGAGGPGIIGRRDGGRVPPTGRCGDDREQRDLWRSLVASGERDRAIRPLGPAGLVSAGVGPDTSRQGLGSRGMSEALHLGSG